MSYKAKRVGVPVVLVDPRNTSRRCPACGYTDKAVMQPHVSENAERSSQGHAHEL